MYIALDGDLSDLNLTYDEEERASSRPQVHRRVQEGEEGNRPESGGQGDKDMSTGGSSTRWDLGSPVVPIQSSA